MAAVKMTNLSKAFGGVLAVQNIELEVAEGARHVIFGPNGAGKTTLFGLISGEIQPTSGRVHLHGNDVTRLGPSARARLGLGRTYQVTSLFGDLTVGQNVTLACLAADRARFNGWRPVSTYGDLRRRVASVLEAEHLHKLCDRTVRSLAYGQQRLLEIVLALASQPRVLLLDEPTAGLGRSAARGIMDRVANLPESVTVILIEHDLDVAFRVSQTATVMARGELVAHGTLDEIRRNPMVQELYLGAAK